MRPGRRCAISPASQPPPTDLARPDIQSTHRAGCRISPAAAVSIEAQCGSGRYCAAEIAGTGGHPHRLQPVFADRFSLAAIQSRRESLQQFRSPGSRAWWITADQRAWWRFGVDPRAHGRRAALARLNVHNFNIIVDHGVFRLGILSNRWLRCSRFSPCSRRI